MLQRISAIKNSNRMYSLSESWNSFLVLYDRRNFSLAAKSLGISQSALSKIIQKLEETIGITLFDRRVRPIRPTPEAVALYDEIRRNAANIEALIKTLRSENFLRPILRFGCTESTRRLVAPRVAESFGRRISRFIQFTGSSDVLVKRLLDHEADVILICDSFDEIKGLTRRFVYAEPSVILLPQTLAATRANWTLDELLHCGLPMISISGNSGAGRLNDRFLASQHLQFPSLFEVDSDVVLVEMIKEELGWAISRPSTLLSGIDYEGKIAKLPIFNSEDKLKFYVVNRMNEFENEAEEIATLCRRCNPNILIEEQK